MQLETFWLSNFNADVSVITVYSNIVNTKVLKKANMHHLESLKIGFLLESLKIGFLTNVNIFNNFILNVRFPKRQLTWSQ